jgi:hypothetical protein
LNVSTSDFDAVWKVLPIKFATPFIAAATLFASTASNAVIYTSSPGGAYEFASIAAAAVPEP